MSKGFFNIEELTLSNIEKKVSEESIWHFLLPNFSKVNKMFKLRDEDDASAVIRFYNNKLWFKDFGKTHKGLSWVSYLMRYEHMGFNQALSHINIGFGLKLGGETNVRSSKPKLYEKRRYRESPLTIIKYRSRNWLPVDYSYWFVKYKLDEEFLDLGRVVPVSHYWINGKCIVAKEDSPTYIYKIGNRKKVYTPLAKKYKWISNTTKDDIFGLHLLKPDRKYLFIASSYKDALVLLKAGYNAIPTPSENSFIPEKLFIRIKNKEIIPILLFDNDDPGVANAKIFGKKFNIYLLFMPRLIINNRLLKDPSDYVELMGYKKLKRFINYYLKQYHG